MDQLCRDQYKAAGIEYDEKFDEKEKRVVQGFEKAKQKIAEQRTKQRKRAAGMEVSDDSEEELRAFKPHGNRQLGLLGVAKAAKKGGLNTGAP